jgi:hypothetical protein
MLSAVFGPDLLILFGFILIPLCFLGFSIFAIVDASSHSKLDFYAAGYSKTAWIVVIGVFTLFYGFGCLNAAYYLIAVRPKIVRIEAARRSPPPNSSGSDVDSPLGFCSNCGAAIAGAGRYCSSCGATVPR